MAEWSSAASLRYKYTYTDNGGHTETKIVGLSTLNSLWGAGVQDILVLDDFRRLTLEVGKRKAVIEPAKAEGKGTR